VQFARVAQPRNWGRVVTYLASAVLLLLIVQYFLGLWTNVYAPAHFSSFDSGSNYAPSLNFHIVNGDVLFLLSIVKLVFAALARQLRLVAPAVLLVVSIYVAGEFGMAYVNSTPNNPIDSFGMGGVFLVALYSAASLVIASLRSRPVVPSTPEIPTTGAQVS
jgi:hypothetical protein